MANDNEGRESERERERVLFYASEALVWPPLRADKRGIAATSRDSPYYLSRPPRTVRLKQ